MTWLHDFHIALTFLTRLGRARITSSEEISRSMAMYPLVGLVIGSVLAMLAAMPISAWVGAWLLTGANVFLTRGLHWDGWADLWDGWGSGATGERFWNIVKDSHVGAFGVMGLILGMGLQTALFEQAIAQHRWSIILLAPVFGRMCCLLLARLGRKRSRPGLGSNALAGATPRALLIGTITTLCSALPGPLAPTLAGITLAACPLALLLRLATRQNGLNGDFLGAAIIAGETSILLPLAFLTPA